MSSSLNVFGATGLIINNKTYVPVRGVFEELGFSVSYDNETATAIISDSKFTIKIPKDKNYFLVNEDSIKPDTPQKIVNSSLLLPLRAIGDSIEPQQVGTLVQELLISLITERIHMYL